MSRFSSTSSGASMTLSRRHFGASLIGAAAASMIAAKASAQSSGGFLSSLLPGNSTPRLMIGLADISLSTGGDTLDLYRTTLRGFFGGVHTGDSVLIGPIADQGLAVTPKAITLAAADNTLKQRAIEKKAKAAILSEIDSLLAKEKANRSLLLETLASMAPYVARARAQGSSVTICMCTDGLECSEISDFGRASFDDKKISPIIARLTKDRQLIAEAKQNLPPIDLMIVGVGDRDPRRAAVVRRFWESYTAAAGVTLSFYARTAPQFS